jgi:hypothetical protein
MSRPEVYAFVITAHGYGHASREMEVARALLARRPAARAVFFTAAPAAVFADYLAADPAVFSRVHVVPYRADVGLAQRDGLRMDPEATLSALEGAFADPEAAERALAEALAVHRPSVVIADVPPVAFGAAARLGVPSVAVGNFDWAAVYGAYAAGDPAFGPWAELCARWQTRATVAVHLTPGPPLTAFGRVEEGGVIARRLVGDPHAIRERLAVPPGHRAVLASFGGFGLDDADRRMPPIPGVTWILSDPMPDLGRPDTRFVRGIPYLGLLAACDAVFTKPGYGTVSEAARHRTRILYTDRGDFLEYPYLVRWMEEHLPSAYVPSSELGTERGGAALREALEALFAQPDRWPEVGEGADRVADVVEGVPDALAAHPASFKLRRSSTSKPGR